MNMKPTSRNLPGPARGRRAAIRPGGRAPETKVCDLDPPGASAAETPTSGPRRDEHGYVMIVVLGLMSVGALMLANNIAWVNNTATLNGRNNEYFSSCYAAEAATEKVLSSMSQDFQNYGSGKVYNNLSSYANLVPSSADDPYWANYTFTKPGSTANQILINRTATGTNIPMTAPYSGLIMVADTYQIIANASMAGTQTGTKGAVGQEINLGAIPLFQFAIFYQDDLEINPGANMNVRGPVHGNSAFYSEPPSGLTFWGDVSSSGLMSMLKDPLDPSSRSYGATNVQFKGFHLSGVAPLNLPVGTNTTSSGGGSSTADNVHAVLEIPPTNEDPSSPAGTNRYYNKADLIVLISNGVVTATSGVWVDGQSTTITDAFFLNKVINTNDTFYSKRESLNIEATDLNVSNLVVWNATNTVLRPLIQSQGPVSQAGNVQTVYIADMRSTSNAIVITNFTVNTNITFVTNTTVTTALTNPPAGTYIGTVNNTTMSTNTPPPKPASPPALNITTNLVNTNTVSYPGAGVAIGSVFTNSAVNSSGSYPSAGTYIGTVTTNTTVTSNNTFPGAGTYIPPVTTNGSNPRYTFNKITGYSYNKITGYNYNMVGSYSYSLPAFVYNAITGVQTNLAYNTNYFYTTNYNIFAESGVALKQAQMMPPNGLTVASVNPAYIFGDFNVTTDRVHYSQLTTDTRYTRASSIASDAITILSTNWNSANSSSSISSRVAKPTTVNAAFLTGNVPSNGTSYSGGVENFPRFLEDWANVAFWYNGSMVCMFQSQIANAPWGGSDVYNPPTRNWAFDNNLMTNLPPASPKVITLNRGRWAHITPNATRF